MLELKDKNPIDKMVKEKKLKKYIKVKCHKCGNEMIIYSKISTQVNCTKCSEIIAVPTGGKSSVKAEILELI
jgi:small subunit ribosomal protein S27e